MARKASANRSMAAETARRDDFRGAPLERREVLLPLRAVTNDCPRGSRTERTAAPSAPASSTALSIQASRRGAIRRAGARRPSIAGRLPPPRSSDEVA